MTMDNTSNTLPYDQKTGVFGIAPGSPIYDYYFTNYTSSGKDLGSVTLRVVLKWCEDEEVSCYYSAMNLLHTKAAAENHKKANAFSWFDNHMSL